MQNVTITTQPTVEPVTLTECKQFMRVDITDDDDLISELVIVARQMCEEYTRRKFINTTVTLSLDRFPVKHKEKWWDGVRDGAISELYGYADCVKLPYAPVSSVTSIKTYDADNAESTLSASVYRLDTGGNILLNDGQVWPSNLRDRDAVRIAYVAGYGATGASVPAPVKHAIKMTVSAMYDDRSCVAIPHGARLQLDTYRVLEERGNAM